MGLLCQTVQTDKSSVPDSNMNGRVVKSDEGSSSIGEDDDIATVEETFDETETSSGLANTSPVSLRGSSPNPLMVSTPNPGSNAKMQTSESSPTSAAVASVQAALTALQAGQMSLNQVHRI